MNRIMRLILLVVFFIGSCSVMGAPTASVYEVVISFDFKKHFKLATNQFVVWIENGSGEHVKTVFVTEFMAKNGWTKRPDGLVEWRKAIHDQPVETISGATPHSGRVELVWDLKDANGYTIPDGDYTLRLEANTAWKTYFEYKCLISIKDKQPFLGDAIQQITGEAPLKQDMIENVQTQTRKSRKANRRLQCL